jgi:hypothetical protein
MELKDLQRVSEVTPEVAAAVKDLFEYHKWEAEKAKRGNLVRESLSMAFLDLIVNVPPCPTRSRALNCILDARMLANQAITFDGKI